MPDPLLLDTCAAIWLMAGAPMSVESLEAIRTARREGVDIAVSPITAWEIGTLVRKSKLRLTMTPEEWFDALLSKPGIRLAPMPPKILIASNFLPNDPPKDPADRIVAATAREYGYRVVTRDGELIPYSAAGHLMAVAC